jgi:hypothetical protein
MIISSTASNIATVASARSGAELHLCGAELHLCGAELH